MTIEEIDKKGFAVKFFRQASTQHGTYRYVILQRHKKTYIAWSPIDHTEFTIPILLGRVTCLGLY